MDKEIKELIEHIQQTGEYDKIIAIITEPESRETKVYRMSDVTEIISSQAKEIERLNDLLQLAVEDQKKTIDRLVEIDKKLDRLSGETT